MTEIHIQGDFCKSWCKVRVYLERIPVIGNDCSFVIAGKLKFRLDAYPSELCDSLTTAQSFFRNVLVDGLILAHP